MNDVAIHNRDAWDRQATLNNAATVAVSVDDIQVAGRGLSNFSMTGARIIPPTWLDGIAGRTTLCLALGGGQQVPMLAAAGALVTSVENSSLQLQRDADVAKQSGLEIECILEDMQRVDLLAGRSFDRAFIGLGLQFIRDPQPVWNNVARLLEPGGELIVAVVNPVQYLFGWPAYSEGDFHVAHALPYSDIESLSPEQRLQRFDAKDPIEFGHTFEQTIGGLCRAGFSIEGFFEDFAPSDPFAEHMATFFVLRASKR